MIVLSPHLDDAAFSLGAAMALAAAAGEAVHVVNVFTRYAGAAAMRRREQEDLAAMLAVGPRARSTPLGFDDAPLRKEHAAHGLYRPHGLLPDDHPMVDRLSLALEPHLDGGICFVPLAVGGHVDHLVLLHAALRLMQPGATCFYEDLPYAGWLPEPAAQQAAERARALGAPALAPDVLRFTTDSARAKEAVVRCYASQLDDRTLEGINAAGNRHRGERIWRPKK